MHVPSGFRDATLADLPALLALEQQFPGDRLGRRAFRHHLRRPSSRLRVACAGEAAGGYSLILHRADSADARLYSLIVAPALRGGGLGARLLADAERCARADGAHGLRLEVRADNATALRLYLRAGYVRSGARIRYYEDGADAVRLRKDLSAD